MQPGGQAFFKGEMGAEKTADNCIQARSFFGRKRHAKQPEFKRFMFNETDQVPGFPFQEIFPAAVEFFKQGEPPGNHVQDFGRLTPYLVVVALLVLAVMIDGLRAEGDFVRQG